MDSGMAVGNFVKLSGGSNETHDITDGYDNANRLTTEASVSGSYGYDASYVYDLVGNRRSRTVNANGQVLTTDYDYIPGTDKLLRETHTGPVCARQVGNSTYYAYANAGGGFYYRGPDGHTIGSLKAFILGLPSALSRVLLMAVMILAPLLLFAPAIWQALKSVRDGDRLRYGIPTKGMCLLLAFTMLLGPEIANDLAYGDMQYSQLATCTWGRGGTAIEYTYDDNGSVETKTTKEGQTVTETVTYAYDLAGRLKQAVSTGGGVAQTTDYAYGHAGNRVSSSTDGITTTYLIDSHNPTGYSQTLEETVTSGGTTAKLTTYLIGDDVHAQTVTESGTTSMQWLLYDGHGSTRQLADNAGNVIDSYGYDAYGVMLGGNPTQASPVATNLLYSGEHFDSGLGQYYLRARNYDPLNGRFTSLDPFAGNTSDPQSLHKYTYCHNDPVNGIDPSGLFGEFSLSRTLVTMGISALVGAIVGGAIGRATGIGMGRGAVLGALLGGSLAWAFATGNITKVLMSAFLQMIINVAIDVGVDLFDDAKIDMTSGAILGSMFTGLSLGAFSASITLKFDWDDAKVMASAGFTAVMSVVTDLLDRLTQGKDLITREAIIQYIGNALVAGLLSVATNPNILLNLSGGRGAIAKAGFEKLSSEDLPKLGQALMSLFVGTGGGILVRTVENLLRT